MDPALTVSVPDYGSWYNPVLNPVFLVRNRMLTRVVAKQAKTTKVKNKFVDRKKKFKRILSCLFGGRRSVQFRRKKLGVKVQAKSSNLPCPVLLRTRSSHRLSSQLFAAVSTPNIAELVLFGFFCPQSWFYGGPNTFCQEKHQHFHVDRQLVTK